MQTIIRSNFVNMNIHEQLRFLRKRTRRTQDVIGDLSNLSSRTIRAFETAERLPDLATLSILIEVLCRDDYEASVVLQAWEKASECQNYRFLATI